MSTTYKKEIKEAKIFFLIFIVKILGEVGALPNLTNVLIIPYRCKLETSTAFGVCQ